MNLKLNLAVAGTLASLLMVFAAPAGANVTRTFDIKDGAGGADGAGRTWGSVTWVDDNHFTTSRYTKDVCPGDDEAVGSWIQIYTDIIGGPDDLFDTLHSVVRDGCGTSQKKDYEWGYSRLDRLTYREVWRLRVCVDVGNGDGGNTCTPWFDNPYSNDPTRDGM